MSLPTERLCCTLAYLGFTDSHTTNGLSFEFVIPDKKAACFALGGALKARKFWTLQQCEIECCTGSYCNTQTPTLTQAAITVFQQGAGPKHCHACAERNEPTCAANQQNQTCATDQNSLGTTHCGSAAGKYQDESGQVHNGFIRGCIDCAGN